MKLLDDIFDKNKIISIAEIGLNHNGDFKLASLMIKKAKEAGADAVKFQTFVPENFYSIYTNALLKKNSQLVKDSQQIDFFKKYNLQKDELRKLFNLSKKYNIEFFSAPFDVESLMFLENLGVRLYKIASSEITNHDLLYKIAQTGKPVIISTGMAEEPEIKKALSILKKNNITLMHCVSLYPTANEDANLLRIQKLRELYCIDIGYSDHCKGYKSVIGAGFLGAKIIEKHLRYDDKIECPDFTVSINPRDFKNMVDELQECTLLRGNGQINCNIKEKEVAKTARKSFFAANNLKKGDIIKDSDLIAKRPGIGIPIKDKDKLIGKKLNKNIIQDYIIKFDDIYK